MTDRRLDDGPVLLSGGTDRAAGEPCRRCAAPVPDQDRFCPVCGTDLRIERGGTMVVVGADEPARSCPDCGGTGRAEASMPGRASGVQWCRGCRARLGEAADRVEVDLRELAGTSDRGLVHRRNEDAIALGRVLDGDHRPRAGVVCDGVSSTVHPEEASRAAAAAALDVLLCEPGERSAGPELRMRAAVAAAAAAVAAPGGGAEGPSCTLVAALVDDGEITVGWVGDSRAYWLPDEPDQGPGLRLTEDHSWAAEMVAYGLMNAETAALDRRAHAITRWLGPLDHPEPDIRTLRPQQPGTLLLCSDGLWNYLPEPEDLVAVARTADTPAAMAGALTRAALDAGGRDNISVVAIPVGG